jgi:hypothetical protein
MIKKYHSFAAISILAITLLASCEGEDPKKEDVPEMVTKVTLTFTAPGATPIVVSAVDPDGEGVKDIAPDGPINLAKGTTYVMSIGLINALAEPTSDAYNVTTEVEEEGDEHMFFFGWTGDAFSNPAGDGNIDVRNDPVRYEGKENSKDDNGLPLGITTTWTTAAIGAEGASLRIMLKHQPGLKTATSDSKTGETDVDVSFTLNVK